MTTTIRDIFINIAVTDLGKSMEFFQTLGFEFNMQFSNENGVCLILGNNIYVMLLTAPFFQQFTNREICNPRTHTEMLLCIPADNREWVDSLVNAAIVAGGKDLSRPQEYDFMYSRSFEDLDGHIWEVVWMNGTPDGSSAA